MDGNIQPKEMYIPTIGIECHVQLRTKTKLFAGVGNDAREASPNTLISPLCIGLPGTLPVLNAEAINLAIRAGLALRAEISEKSHFDRKHYFYPDLPKGYQITQYEAPIIKNGIVETAMPDGRVLSVRILRAHLEEDAGKSTHPDGADYSLVDLNRAGTPLLEIVSQPDMHSAEEARAYAKELFLLMKYAEVSDVDLYHGNMRFDVNVSLGAQDELGTRTEVKNLNSFKSIERAVEYEIKRQTDVLTKGGKVVQETLGWDEAKQKTIGQRSKEEAHDYRYFPEPDIPPIVIPAEVIAKAAQTMPLLPTSLRDKFSELGISRAQVDMLLDEPELAHIVRYLIEAHDATTAKTITNWCLGELQRQVIDNNLMWNQVEASIPRLVELAAMVDGEEISSTSAKDILLETVINDKSPKSIAESKNLTQVSDESQLLIIVQQVINENPKAVEDIKAGQPKAIGFLVGQIMKISKGSANPGVVQQIIKKQLGVEG